MRRAVADMFERIAEAGGALGARGDRILALKDEAKALLQQTEGIQLPIDLLLYAKTVSYVFALGAEIAPEVDLMKLSLPYLLQFLAQKDSSPARGPSASALRDPQPLQADEARRRRSGRRCPPRPRPRRTTAPRSTAKPAIDDR